MKPTIFLLVFFALISVVSAAPPFVQTYEGENGLYVQYPSFDVYPVNSKMNILFKAFNASGVSVDNTTTDCFVGTCNTSDIIEFGEAYYDGGAYTYELNSSLYPVGTYHLMLYCNQSEHGGFTSQDFKVSHLGSTTDSEHLLPTVFVLTVFSVLFVVVGAYLLFRKQGGARVDN